MSGTAFSYLGKQYRCSHKDILTAAKAQVLTGIIRLSFMKAVSAASLGCRRKVRYFAACRFRFPTQKDDVHRQVHDRAEVGHPFFSLRCCANKTSVWQLEKWAVYIMTGTYLEPIPLPEKPRYLPSRDVSMVFPTIGFDTDLIVSLRSWLSNQPKEIIIVTSSDSLDALVALLDRNLSIEEQETIQTPQLSNS